jgi:hypothetical protein
MTPERVLNRPRTMWVEERLHEVVLGYNPNGLEGGVGEVLEEVPYEVFQEAAEQLVGHHSSTVLDYVLRPLITKWERIIRARRFGQILRGEVPR